MYNTRQQTANNITKEQWKQYFDGLFKDKHDDENIDEYSMPKDYDDTMHDITEGELGDIILNSEITDEEIIKSVQSLKRGQSGGIGEIIPEVFIHSIDITPIKEMIQQNFRKRRFPYTMVLFCSYNIV